MHGEEAEKIQLLGRPGPEGGRVQVPWKYTNKGWNIRQRSEEKGGVRMEKLEVNDRGAV